MERNKKKITIQILMALVAIAISADYIAYRRGTQWWAKLNKDLYVGMPITPLHKYLTENGELHGITGLIEFNNSQGHWFVFHNQNGSILLRAINHGIDELLQCSVVVRLDQNEKLENVDTSE